MRVRLFATVVTASFTAPLLATHARAAPERLRIRARTSISSVGVTRGAEWVEVAGSLRDDAELPVAGAVVRLELPAGAEARAEGCAPPGTGAREPEDAGRTGDTGLFCLRLRATTDLRGASVRYAGDELHEAAETSVPPDGPAKELRLAFELDRVTADLDSPSLVVNVTTRMVDDSPSEPLRLTLHSRDDAEPSGGEVELGAVFVPAGTRALFNVETALLGKPGSGKLVVRFAGSGTTPRTEATALLLRSATARVALAAPPPPADPSEGVALLVGVTSAVGPVATGWVEALLDGRPVGIGKVEAGAARVVATFPAPRGRPALVAVRYVPDAPGFLPGPPVTAEIRILPPSPWRSAPWLLAALAVMYWVVLRSWRRPPRSRTVKPSSGEGPRGFAAVDVIERGPARSGWRGRVVDAHEGTPIEGALVQVVVPSFSGEGVARMTRSGRDGTFELAPADVRSGETALWKVASPHHTALSQPLPPEGVLSVGLVSRRRTLLDRLVQWTRSAGWRGAMEREPTPGDVRTLGVAEQREEVAAWASALERAAYAETPPDEQREAALVSAEPSLPSSPLARLGAGGNAREKRGSEPSGRHER